MSQEMWNDGSLIRRLSPVTLVRRSGTCALCLPVGARVARSAVPREVARAGTGMRWRQTRCGERMVRKLSWRRRVLRSLVHIRKGLEIVLFPLDATNSAPVNDSVLTRLGRQYARRVRLAACACVDLVSRRYSHGYSALVGTLWALVADVLPRSGVDYYAWDVLTSACVCGCIIVFVYEREIVWRGLLLAADVCRVERRRHRYIGAPELFVTERVRCRCARAARAWVRGM